MLSPQLIVAVKSAAEPSGLASTKVATGMLLSAWYSVAKIGRPRARSISGASVMPMSTVAVVLPPIGVGDDELDLVPGVFVSA